MFRRILKCQWSPRLEAIDDVKVLSTSALQGRKTRTAAIASIYYYQREKFDIVPDHGLPIGLHAFYAAAMHVIYANHVNRGCFATPPPRFLAAVAVPGNNCGTFNFQKASTALLEPKQLLAEPPSSNEYCPKEIFLLLRSTSIIYSTTPSIAPKFTIIVL